MCGTAAASESEQCRRKDTFGGTVFRIFSCMGTISGILFVRRQSVSVRPEGAQEDRSDNCRVHRHVPYGDADSALCEGGRPFGRAYRKEKQGIGNKRELTIFAQPVSPTVGNGAGLPTVIRTIRYTAVKGTSGFSNLFFRFPCPGNSRFRGPYMDCPCIRKLSALSSLCRVLLPVPLL